MRSLIKNKIYFLLAFANFSAAEPVWYNQKLEGWYYFQENEDGNELSGLSPEEAHGILEEEKQKMQESLSLAVLSPTKENVENYVSLSNRWMKQSSLFADAWGSLEKKPAPELANSYFLLFCFKGKDPASSQAAEIAIDFARKNGWALKAVSVDGYGTKGIEKFETDLGIVGNLKIETTPSFYAIDPFKHLVTLLGAGLPSPEELQRAVKLQCGNKNE